MRQPERTSPGDSPRSSRKRGFSPLAAVSILLLVCAFGVLTWLHLSGPPEVAEAVQAVVVELSPPPNAAPLPSETGSPDNTAVTSAPTTAEPAAPAPRTESARVPTKTMSPQAPAPAVTDTAAPAPQETGSPAPPVPAATDTTESQPPADVAPAAGEAKTLEAPVPAPAGTESAATGSTEGKTEKTPSPSETAKLVPDSVPASPTAKPPPVKAVGGLRPAPDPALVETTRLGPLPRVSPDGRKAWQTYARPFDAVNRRPRVAVIVSGLGLSGAATEAAIQRLPGPITLGFAPYAKGLPQWIALARAAGHEVLLDLPMEPVNFPTDDPGPRALMTNLTASQNQERLHWLLGRVTGYVGVVNRMGSRFTTSEPHVRPVLQELQQRGLLFIDSRSSLRSIAARMAREIGLPNAVNNRFIDAEASRDAIDMRLQEMERIAKSTGRAVGIASPFPVTINRLAQWAQSLDGKGLILAPVSALVR